MSHGPCPKRSLPECPTGRSSFGTILARSPSLWGYGLSLAQHVYVGHPASLQQSWRWEEAMERVEQRSGHYPNRRPRPLRYALLSVVSLIILAGCATPPQELSQEVRGLLKQEAEAENRRQTTQMDNAIARLHTEVARLQAAVDHTDDALGTLAGRLQALEQQLAARERQSGQDLMLLTGRIQALER